MSREWTQLKAALLFWRWAADTSRQHPCRHPKVEGLFKHESPMSLEELDVLLEEMDDAEAAHGRS